MAHLAEIDVKKYGHHFFVGVDEDTGKIDFSVDGDKKTEAKQLSDGKVIFYSEREIIVKDTIQLVRELELTEADFRLLKSAQDRVLSDKAAERSKAKKAAGDYRRQIQRWKQKVKKRRLPDKSYEKYCVHDITIGADRYSFLEHIVLGAEDAVIINPNYRLENDMPGIGGRVARYGELIVWEYWEEDKGWYVVRELTFNEKICVTLIYDYGYFSKGNTKKGQRRMSLRRVKKNKQKEQKERESKENGESTENKGKKGIRLFQMFTKNK